MILSSESGRRLTPDGTPERLSSLTFDAGSSAPNVLHLFPRLSTSRILAHAAFFPECESLFDGIGVKITA